MGLKREGLKVSLISALGAWAYRHIRNENGDFSSINMVQKKDKEGSIRRAGSEGLVLELTMNVSGITENTLPVSSDIPEKSHLDNKEERRGPYKNN